MITFLCCTSFLWGYEERNCKPALFLSAYFPGWVRIEGTCWKILWAFKIMSFISFFFRVDELDSFTLTEVLTLYFFFAIFFLSSSPFLPFKQLLLLGRGENLCVNEEDRALPSSSPFLRSQLMGTHPLSPQSRSWNHRDRGIIHPIHSWFGDWELVAKPCGFFGSEWAPCSAMSINRSRLFSPGLKSFHCNWGVSVTPLTVLLKYPTVI